MIVLVDYNLTGYVVLVQGTLAAEGWLELLSIRFVTLKEVGLAADSNDRIIWRFAQSNQMLLLTANLNAIPVRIHWNKQSAKKAILLLGEYTESFGFLSHRG
jgi:predicted nuclease of predicted toxin-antitoxin system